MKKKIVTMVFSILLALPMILCGCFAFYQEDLIAIYADVDDVVAIHEKIIDSGYSNVIYITNVYQMGGKYVVQYEIRGYFGSWGRDNRNKQLEEVGLPFRFN